MNTLSPDRANNSSGILAVGTLLPQHLADLRSSGLTDETIRACGFRTITDPAEVSRILGWTRAAFDLGPCLAIPYLDLGGRPTGYVRTKPDRPRVSTGRDGARKFAKYESPKGQGNRAYFPAGIKEAIADPSSVILVTEGEKKAAAATQAGFSCIGLTGVYGFQRKREEKNGVKGPRRLIDDLAAIDWRGRTVVIAYDSDAATKPDVLAAEHRLAEVLAAAGANVLAIRLPDLPDGKKCGLDDYLLAHGRDALRRLIQTARPVAKAIRQAEAVPESKFPFPGPGESWDDPHRLARLLLGRHQTADGKPTLLRWREEYYQWNGTVWTHVPNGEIVPQIVSHCRDVFESDLNARISIWQMEQANGGKSKMPTLPAVTCRLKGDVDLNLASLTTVRDQGDEPPFWVRGDRGIKAIDLIAAPNGLFRLEDIAAGRGPVSPPTPDLFTTTALSFPVETNPNEPALWLATLGEWFGGDRESIAALQEWFGYLLSADTSAQKILYVVGPPRSGKGTIREMITAIVGFANVATTNLTALGESFGLENLLHKRVAVIPDARPSKRADLGEVVERLLALSGGDPPRVNRKNKSAITTRFGARFVFFSNMVIGLPDPTRAMASRLHVLVTPNSWLGREDPTLKDRLVKELPGILKWAAAGWVRLKANGMRFTQSRQSSSRTAAFAEPPSNIAKFVRECCHVGPEWEALPSEVHDAWTRWASARKVPQTAAIAFFHELRKTLPQIDESQSRRVGKRVRLYRGIGVKDGEFCPDLKNQAPARDGTRVEQPLTRGELGKQDIYSVDPMTSRTRVPSRTGGQVATTDDGTDPEVIADRQTRLQNPNPVADGLLVPISVDEDSTMQAITTTDRSISERSDLPTTPSPQIQAPQPSGSEDRTSRSGVQPPAQPSPRGPVPRRRYVDDDRPYHPRGGS